MGPWRNTPSVLTAKPTRAYFNPRVFILCVDVTKIAASLFLFEQYSGRVGLPPTGLYSLPLTEPADCREGAERLSRPFG
jgi:hypothetical protein